MVELILAMTVVAIVLAGVAAVAFALSSARDQTGEVSRKQAHLRHAMVQLGETIRNAKLVCHSSDSEVVLWKSDSNRDGRMNINEMASIRIVSGGTQVSLGYFAAAGNPEVEISEVTDYSGRWWQAFGATASEAVILPECSGATIFTDAAAPHTRYVSLAFSMMLDNQIASNSISGRLGGNALNLLDSNGTIVSDDD
ncbi:MAG TPA: hypothetical protein VLH60_05205 [Sedimentisphaerales bacterium]|nr:hypothetical protein [Sedimentisphaerales bacterium]